MPEPTKIPRAFADSGDKNSIPDSSGGLGFASWQEGFPAITGTPFAQGGVAPKRADFNGIFNAISSAIVWAQQGGVYAYDATVDYEVGNIAVDSGVLYICKIANGPSSAVKDPATDIAETYWGKVFPQNGTFDRMFFSQTSGSYTAPYTGVYRITLKGGGGGGAGADGKVPGCSGAEGGMVIFYATLTKSTSYAYTIGAGGTAGALATSGGNGGNTTMTIGGTTYTANGGGGGGTSASFSTAEGGTGSPSSAYIIKGAPGQAAMNNMGTVSTNYILGPTGGGNGGGRTGGTASAGVYGGGGGGGPYHSATSKTGGAGGAGYILIEYMG